MYNRALLFNKIHLHLPSHKKKSQHSFSYPPIHICFLAWSLYQALNQDIFTCFTPTLTKDKRLHVFFLTTTEIKLGHVWIQFAEVAITQVRPFCGGKERCGILLSAPCDTSSFWELCQWGKCLLWFQIVFVVVAFWLLDSL